MSAHAQAKKAIAFVDGQNLFAAARDAFGITTASYGVAALSQAIAAQRGWEVAEVRFYTGVPERHDNPGLRFWWTARLRRLRADGVAVTARPLRRRRKRARLDDGRQLEFDVLEEKGIDIRIALDVVRAVLERQCDVVLLFSQDQDFAELAREVRRIAARQRRWVDIASAYPVGSGTRNSRGVDGTDWIRVDRGLYDACLDERDSRP